MKSEVQGGSVLLRQQQFAVKLLGRQAPLQRGGCGTTATLPPSPVVSVAHSHVHRRRVLGGARRLPLAVVIRCVCRPSVLFN